MKRVKIFAGILGSGFLLVLAFTLFNKETPKDMLYIKAERTDFVVSVETKGEIEAASAVTIYMPEIFFTGKIELYEITMTDIVAEGTHVVKGDYVAKLDHGAVEKEIEEEEAYIEKRIEQLEVAKIDTAVKLSQQRNQIAQNVDNLEEKKIILEQSIYDSKAVQRKAELGVQQAERLHENSINSYQRMLMYEKNRVASIQEKLNKNLEVKGYYEQLMKDLTIYAPEQGIVIYAQDRRRNKIKAGSILHRYRDSHNRVATLPNLDSLLSVTYINEIDISKIYKGQQVALLVDAMPGTEISGKVMHISNIGQNSSSNDGKVFRVEIYIENPEKDLKPAMSTTNRVIISTFDDALVVPVNAVHSDGINNFVYLKSGMNIIKKQVIPGLQNNNKIIIEKGLKDGDKCLIREPQNKDEIQLVALK